MSTESPNAGALLRESLGETSTSRRTWLTASLAESIPAAELWAKEQNIEIDLGRAQANLHQTADRLAKRGIVVGPNPTRTVEAQALVDSCPPALTADRAEARAPPTTGTRQRLQARAGRLQEITAFARQWHVGTD